MRIFDFNIHLPCSISKNSVDQSILEETSMSFSELEFCLNKQFKDSNLKIESGNFMLFNPTLFSAKSEETFFSTAKKLLDKPLFTTLIDFRDEKAMEHIEIAYEQGVRGLKFHSYVQKIDDKHFNTIVLLSKKAEDLGMFIAVDASYGSLDMYRCNNLQLVSEIARVIHKTPIIILHSGGARVLEAMLLADAKKNIYLENSFSINYYKGSSIEDDFAFAYKKLGAHKIFYGSDHPYIGIDENIDFTLKYLQRHNFSSSNIDQIMFQNADKLRMSL